jgi:C4-type Zn-finger protein
MSNNFEDESAEDFLKKLNEETDDFVKKCDEFGEIINRAIEQRRKAKNTVIIKEIFGTKSLQNNSEGKDFGPKI